MPSVSRIIVLFGSDEMQNTVFRMAAIVVFDGLNMCECHYMLFGRREMEREKEK
jgi:hypothetical protein